MLVPKHIQGDHGWILETGAKKEKTLCEHHNMGPIYEIIRATFRWFTVKIIPVSGSAKEFDKKMWS